MPSNNFFTTDELSQILQMSKSTIKRWSDEGKLKCFRTPGGHRKFRSEDLYTFMSENHYENSSIQRLEQGLDDELIIRTIIHKKEYGVLQSVCFSAAVKGKKEELFSLFSKIYHNRLSLSAIFDYVIFPTVKKIDQLFVQQKLSLAEVHLAQNILTSSISQLTDGITKRPQNHKTIVCASLDNGKNDIELKALTALLEIDGFTALNLGNGMNVEGLNQFLVLTKPFAVCIYLAPGNLNDIALTELQSISETAKMCGTHCVLIGSPLNFEQQYTFDEADVYSSFTEFETMQTGKAM